MKLEEETCMSTPASAPRPAGLRPGSPDVRAVARCFSYGDSMILAERIFSGFAIRSRSGSPVVVHICKYAPRWLSPRVRCLQCAHIFVHFPFSGWGVVTGQSGECKFSQGRRRDDEGQGEGGRQTRKRWQAFYNERKTGNAIDFNDSVSAKDVRGSVQPAAAEAPGARQPRRWCRCHCCRRGSPRAGRC